MRILRANDRKFAYRYKVRFRIGNERLRECKKTAGKLSAVDGCGLFPLTGHRLGKNARHNAPTDSLSRAKKEAHSSFLQLQAGVQTVAVGFQLAERHRIKRQTVNDGPGRTG